MKEKENCVRRFPPSGIFDHTNVKFAPGCTWMGDINKDMPTRECFMSSKPLVFSGEESQFCEMACSVTIPPLGNNQLIPGKKKDQVKISIQSQRKPGKKNTNVMVIFMHKQFETPLS